MEGGDEIDKQIPGSGVLAIPTPSSITRQFPSDCWVSDGSGNLRPCSD